MILLNINVKNKTNGFQFNMYHSIAEPLENGGQNIKVY